MKNRSNAFVRVLAMSSATAAAVLIATAIASCSVNGPDEQDLPFYYTPTNDPRCATFEASVQPENKAYCRALAIKILHQRYPGWRNIPDK